MLQRLFARSDDLRQLRDEGYDLSLSASNNHLLVAHVPYVNSKKEIKYGTLVFVLSTSGDVANAPSDHVAHFIGDQPCDMNGVVIGAITNPSAPQELDTGLRVDRTFSGRLETPFKNFHEKVSRYVTILGGPARAIDPEVTAKTFPPYPLSVEESVFKYADTASSRAGISAVTAKLQAGRVAIVGVGGTGSYVLDLVAKTPVKEIHLFDGDLFSSHNAFRSPGAPSLDELHARPLKVAYLAGIYSKMRRGIIVHDYYVDAARLDEFTTIDFVFLCLDRGEAKKALVEFLHAKNIPFVDVGMGINNEEGVLSGVLRTATSTQKRRDHVMAAIPFGDGDKNDEYAGQASEISDCFRRLERKEVDALS